MKFKVTRQYPTYNKLPISGDELVARITAYLWITYNNNQPDFFFTCSECATTQYMFKAIRFYDYLQSEVLAKARARRFTRHVVRKQIFGN